MAKNDKKVKRINELLKEIFRNPYEGIGKPEPISLIYCRLLVKKN